MTQKMALRSGILVALLAQSATLTACGTDGGEDPAASDPGDGDGDPGDGDSDSGDGDGDASDGDGDAGDGDGDGDAGGDGDGDAGGDGDGDTGGDGDGCEDLLVRRSLSATVRNAGEEGDEECRVSVAVNVEGTVTELGCSPGGVDCYCATSNALPPSGATVTVSDGETILYQLDDLQEIPNGRVCGGPTFDPIEVDYVEALGEAVTALNASIESSVSPAPCDTEADCEALPLGAKACGGPWSYAVVSTESETYEETVALSEELERIERIYNTLADVSSDCAYETAPDLVCESGVCVGTTAN